MKPPTNLWLDLFKISLESISNNIGYAVVAESAEDIAKEAAMLADAAATEVEKRMEHFKPEPEVRSMTAEDVARHDASFGKSGMMHSRSGECFVEPCPDCDDVPDAGGPPR